MNATSWFQCLGRSRDRMLILLDVDASSADDLFARTDAGREKRELNPALGAGGAAAYAPRHYGIQPKPPKHQASRIRARNFNFFTDSVH